MKRLQPFDFKSSPYERPNQDWVCGRKDCGESCASGPDARGHCRAAPECRPRKDGDRWCCTRSDSRGGKCPDGPRPDGSCCRPVPPCVPRRSVRAKRGLAVILVTALTLGGILFAVGIGSDSGRGETIFNPGPLSAPHVAGTANCALCHSAAASSSPLAAAGPHADSQLCVNCHKFGQSATEPHSLPRAILTGLTKEALTASGAARVAGTPATDLTCAACHQEHRGRAADLTQLTNASCQTCHTRQFAGFADGHPDFGTYPYTRRTRLEFDHAAHIATHFPAATKLGQAAPAQCNDCHTTGPDNRLMLTRSFEAACASCHLDAITKPGQKGLAVLGIPGLDKKSLDAKTPGIGHWPADADGELTPFLRHLLAQEPSAATALATLKGADLTNLATASPETTAAAAQLAWSLKELVADLVAGGHAALQKRLGSTAPAAFGQLPAESLRVFTSPDWWPDLLAEVADHRAGRPPAKPAPPPAAAPPAPPPPPPANQNLLGDDLLGDAPRPPSPAVARPAATDDLLGGDDLLAAPAAPLPPVAPKPPAPIAPEKWAAAGGWHVSPSDYTLRYKPSGHADNFLKTWLDLTAADPAARPLFTQIAAASACVKCHSADAAPAPSRALLVQWRADAPAPQTHAFAKFSHGTHFSLLDAKACQTCHQLAPASTAYASSFRDNHDPAKFTSGFQPLSRGACAQCHQERSAGTSCLLCHNYHVGEIAPAPVRSLLHPASPAPR